MPGFTCLSVHALLDTHEAIYCRTIVEEHGKPGRYFTVNIPQDFRSQQVTLKKLGRMEQRTFSNKTSNM